jgi:threonine synthase
LISVADPAFAQAAQRYGFVSGRSTHANRLATIQDTFERFGVMIDTHTADAVKVAREYLTSRRADDRAGNGLAHQVCRHHC